MFSRALIIVTMALLGQNPPPSSPPLVPASPPKTPGPATPPSATSPGNGQPSRDLPAFESDFKAALARANKEGKVLLLDFYTTTCPYCERMMKFVYPEPEVHAFAEKVVWLRVDQNKGEGVALRRQFRAGPTPMYVAVALDGKSAFYRYSGAPAKKGFLHNMSLLPVLRGECEQLRKLALAEKPTPEQRLTLARGELLEGRLDAGKKMLQQIADDDPTNKSGLTDDALVLLGMVKIADSPEYGPWQAYGDWQKVIKQYPTSDRGADAVMYIAKMLKGTGETVKYPKLGELIKDYPDGVDVAGCAKILDEK